MGNTLIQDSKTGHIMGLSEGFVPVGLKEHGGIMYVVSANKDGVGEIGTIPSPVLKLELRKEEISQTKMQVTTSAGPVSTMVGITDFKVYPGEKFLPALNLANIVDNSVPSNFTIQNAAAKSPTNVVLKDRLISTIIQGEGCSHNGLYELKLFSIYGTHVAELKNVQKKPMQPFFKNGTQNTTNNYWYYPGIIDGSVDIEKTWLNKGFHTYPGNLPPGRLAIKAELESIDSFDLPKISQSKYSKQQGTKAPYIEKSGEEYKLYFPGFEYKTKSIRFIGELEITLTHQTSGTQKYHATLSSFATVSVDKAQYYYQIQSSGQGSYKKITYTGSPEDDINKYFTPLFSVSIGKDLNAWYRLEVKYKDIYGGYVDTFVYSFNPYHILNFDESYYGIEWKAETEVAQIYDWTKTSEDTIPFTQQTGVGSSSIAMQFNIKRQGIQPTGSIQVKPQSDPTGGTFYNAAYFTIGQFQLEPDTSLTKTYSHSIRPLDTVYLFGRDYVTITYDVKPNGYQYIHHNLVSQTNEWGTVPYKSPLFTGAVFNTATITVNGQEYGLLQMPPNNKNKDYLYYNSLSGGEQYYSAFWYEKAPHTFTIDAVDGAYITYSVTINNPTGNSNKVLVPFNQDYVSFADQITYDGKFCYNVSVGLPTIRYNRSTLPNLSIYSLIPSFSLCGDTDEELGLRLGLDKMGETKKAWTFDKNLYQTCMPGKNTSESLVSTFEKNAQYYRQSDKGDNLVLDAGVYLITVDAGVYNPIGKFYAKDKQQPNDGSQYGCNTNWDDHSDFWAPYNSSKNSDPRIAVFVHDMPYQIARVDSYINGGRCRTFMPTLLYLPKQSIIRIEWKYVEKLQGIGVFQVKKPVVFNNGDGFDKGDDIRIMYYQHPDLREIILPLEATYQEYAKCLDKTYDYYYGLRSLSSINRHVLIGNVQFCKAPVREGTWVYEYNGTQTDPTYLWDDATNGSANGDGLMEFVYQYASNQPVKSTEIPKVDSLQSNRLEYRKLNTTT